MAVPIKTRVINKHGKESDWNNTTTFIPQYGEMIVYDPDETHPYSRVKMGNGTNLPKDLPFLDAGSISGMDMNNITAAKVAHKLTFGAGAVYTFDGSEDVTVPVYTGGISVET